MGGNLRRRSAIASALGAVVISVFSGCNDPETTVVRDRVRASNDYSSPRALRDASDVVAIVDVAAEIFRGDIRESHSVIFEARVIDAIKNTTSGSTVRVRQLVKPKGVVWTEGPQEELRPGRRYLLFLVEAFPADSAAGDEKLIGLFGLRDGTAAYQDNGGGRFDMVPGLKPAGMMPTTISRSQV